MSTTMTTPWHEVDFWDLEDTDAVEELEVRSLSEVAAEARQGEEALRDRFDVLADELAAATRGMSSTRRAVRHPAFRDILALGNDAIPYLVERLERDETRPIWLRLLGLLTSFQPGAGAESIDESAKAWIRWHKHGGASPGGS